MALEEDWCDQNDAYAKEPVGGKSLEARGPFRSLFEVLIVWIRAMRIERKGQVGEIQKEVQEIHKLVI